MAITRDAEQDAHFDPSACVEAMFRFFQGHGEQGAVLVLGHVQTSKKRSRLFRSRSFGVAGV